MTEHFPSGKDQCFSAPNRATIAADFQETPIGTLGGAKSAAYAVFRDGSTIVGESQADISSA